MNHKTVSRLVLVLLMIILAGLTAHCRRDVSLLEPATHPSFGEVFEDEFVSGLDYAAFANSKYDAFEIDNDVSWKGIRSIRITVPGLNDPSGWFAGGVFYSAFPRDLSGYTALTFWSKSDRTMLADIGFGNDNTGNSLYQVLQKGIVLGTSWQKHTIPIPLADKLTAETGMFQYAAGPDANGLGGTIWFDEITFEKVNTIYSPRINLSAAQVSGTAGALIDPGISGVTFIVDGTDQTVELSRTYFTMTSLNESVATVMDDGRILAVAEGVAEIVIKLGVAAQETLRVVVGEAFGPGLPAPVPAVPAERVISLFSDAYTNHPGINWNTGWQYSTAVLENIDIAGDAVLLYKYLNFVGVEFTAPTIDATTMTHFHLDIWTPEPTSLPKVFKVKLVDFGANGVWSGGDDVEDELSFTANDGLVTDAWVSLDIPLSSFSGLTQSGHIAQLVFSGDIPTLFVDNVYFYNN